MSENREHQTADWENVVSKRPHQMAQHQIPRGV